MGVARSEGEAVAMAARIGYPVVVKVAVAGLAHKSDRGGVRTNIRGPEELRAAYHAFAEAFGSVGDGPVDVVVQAMVEGGLECLVGAVCDPALGPAIVVGLGGTLVEVLEDTAMRVLPIGPADVEAMVGELRGRRLFHAHRGRGQRDLAAFVDAVLGVAAFVEDWAGAIREVDVNPLLVLEEGQGCMAVDALIVPARRAPAESEREATR
jgi:acetyltransferase